LGESFPRLLWSAEHIAARAVRRAKGCSRLPFIGIDLNDLEA
jgi:hypothetical protein